MKKVEKVVHKKISELYPNPKNARNSMDYEEDDLSMQDLMKDIQIRGIMTPLKILSDGLILFGNRRFYAAMYIGLGILPCIIDYDTEYNEVEKLMQQFSENMIRKYPSSMERGKALYEIDKSGIATIEQMKEQTGAKDIDECVREYINFLKTEEAVGKDKVDKVITKAKKRKDWGTISKVVFKRTKIPAETKIDLMEQCVGVEASGCAVETVTQDLQKFASEGIIKSKKEIKQMLVEANRIEEHNILIRKEDWNKLKGRYELMDNKPATFRHYFINYIKKTMCVK